jgi:DNA-binding transcriptional ArsR family regulator
MVNNKPGRLDRTFAALSHPARRRILERLAGGRSRVCRLAAPFAMSLPAVSKHLRVLERAGLIKRHRHGREHLLDLDAAPLRDALAWMERYRRFWEGSLAALADYLENEHSTKRKEGKS